MGGIQELPQQAIQAVIEVVQNPEPWWRWAVGAVIVPLLGLAGGAVAWWIKLRRQVK